MNHPAACVLVMTLALGHVHLAGQEPTPDDAKKLSAQAQRLGQEAIGQFQKGDYPGALERLQRALAIARRLYPSANYPDGHIEIASYLNALGFVSQFAGDQRQCIRYFEETLAMRRKLYPAEKFPDGHANVVVSIMNLATAYRGAGDTTRARGLYEHSLAINRKLYPVERLPAGHADLAANLLYLAGTLNDHGTSATASTHAEQAVAMFRRLYPADQHPDGHVDVARALYILSEVQAGRGAYAAATTSCQTSLAMRQKLYPAERFPNGHPDLVSSLTYLGRLFHDQGDSERATSISEQALAMDRALYPVAKYPDGHPQLAKSMNNRASMFFAQGAYAQALPHYEQALAMLRRLSPAALEPDGNMRLATCMSNLGMCLRALGSPNKALPYVEEALAMMRKLHPDAAFPDGHPGVVGALMTAGNVLHQLDDERARDSYAQAVAMCRKLYPPSRFPHGHPDLALALANLGSTHVDRGAWSEARQTSAEALAIFERVFPASRYPHGHPRIATCLSNLGAIADIQGDYRAALPLLERAFAMHHRLGQDVLETSSAAEALAFLASLPQLRDGLVDVSRHLPETDAKAYRVVWDSKRAVTRVLERRHLAARLAGKTEAALVDRLRDNRRITERLLQDTYLTADERDRELAKLTEQRDQLERDLARALPQHRPWSERDEADPEALSANLPSDSIFIDLLTYWRFGRDPKLPGRKADTKTLHYAAFVVAPKQPVRRVELGAATRIDEAVDAWRRTLEARQDDRSAAQLLSKLVWTKIAAYVPPGCRLAYLAPDGKLARLPWCALPGKSGRVLLEEFTGGMAVVPHGPFLREQLKVTRTPVAGDAVLCVGGVTYGGKWQPLPGTVRELEVVAQAARRAPVILRDEAATSASVIYVLSKARFAHFATHGEFRAAALAEQRQRERDFVARWHEPVDRPLVRPTAAEHALGFAGLVLAKGETLTGLRIVDLPLENLKLVTLSACETGLGELTGGEGVQGLQRAFHLAGCPNVVASLWNVNDAATAALMAKLYHELWVHKRPPIEALREAQLTIYRHPELIRDLAGERGAPRLKEAVAVRAGASMAGTGKHADTKLWAAFVLSGLGK